MDNLDGTAIARHVPVEAAKEVVSNALYRGQQCIIAFPMHKLAHFISSWLYHIALKNTLL